MSIKHSLLVLLGEGDRYGYELRAEFEARTGGVWPLNVGQVYSTLERLERDGQVERLDVDDERQVRYSLTAVGRSAADEWWATPVEAARAGRDDVALKIALAVSTPGVDAAAVIHEQRRSVMAALQELTRTKRASNDEAWDLVADALIFRAEAEVRWLDHTQARLALKTGRRVAGSVPAARASTAATDAEMRA